LRAEAEQVTDRPSLLVFAERAPLALADHHAITGASTAHSWAIVPGDLLTAVSGVPIDVAVERFWADLGLPLTDDRASFAARALELPNLYAAKREGLERPLVVPTRRNGAFEIRLNDSLGENATIAAFDAAMAGTRPAERIVIDLTETPSGGNTVVARRSWGGS
jgi:hypothetical protein